jgi:hypothetical protein
MSKNKPAFEAKIGRIRGTVWRNDTEDGAFYNVTFSRLYKDEVGAWRDSGSFSRDDVLVLAKVADWVHTWICQEGNGERKEAEGNG